MSTTEKPPRPRPDDAEAYPYVLTNQIGEGSFATVYRGYHVVSCLWENGTYAPIRPDEVLSPPLRQTGKLSL